MVQGTATGVSAGEPAPERPGSISGTVVDGSGAVVAGARVTLTREGPSASQELRTGADGQFSFAGIAPGPFHLSIASAGLETNTASGILHAGEFCIVPPIVLQVATAMTEVRVVLSPAEVAEEQVKDQEKQRVLGVIPNFYVSYVPNPLRP